MSLEYAGPPGTATEQTVGEASQEGVLPHGRSGIPPLL